MNENTKHISFESDMAVLASSYLLPLVTLFQSYLNNNQSPFSLIPPPKNDNLDFTAQANRFGFNPISHEVTTEDGYILTLFHIPGRSQYPVLLVHGFLDTSDTWLNRGENSLGITLANGGYDVWFANSRGNRYSRRHVSLNPDDTFNTTYWDFSFHEMGYYDLPAIIDRILKETQAPNLTAIGHSRGNLVFYVLGATRPEYNSKINVLVDLAPICYLQNIKPPVLSLLQAVPIIDQLLNSYGVRVVEVLGYNHTSTKLLRALCTIPLFGREFCLNAIFFPVFGFDPKEFEPSFLVKLIYHFPAGTSWKDFRHISQLIGKNFARYDYGAAENLLAYNSPVPPLYNLTQVTMPIAIIVGRNDRLSTIPDVDILRNQLPNVVDYTINQRHLLNHLDFVLGRHAQDYLYPDIFRILRQYNRV